MSEAQVAQAYVINEYQVGVEQIRLEEHSKNTEENAIYTKDLYEDLENILVVTDSFHVYRGQKSLKNILTKLRVSVVRLHIVIVYWVHFCEVLAVIKYKIVGDI